MISNGDKIGLGVVSLSVILVFLVWNESKSVSRSETQAEKPKKENAAKKSDKKGNSEKKDNKGDNKGKDANIASEVSILQKWELPADLKEVSGIAFLDDQRFACIQDERGTIFIFNRASGKIEREIPFAGTGDYEDITVKGDIAYVVRADGRLYEVDISAGKSSVKEYNTPLTVQHNVEGLCYDKNNDRLLLAIKDDEPSNPGYKGIYAFDLSKKAFIKDPAYKIELQKGSNTSQNKGNKSIMPTAIAIHPITNEIYITDGPQAKLVIMDKSGNIKKLVHLGKDFPQSEGITFSPQGEVFISNEGAKQPGNILKIKVK